LSELTRELLRFACALRIKLFQQLHQLALHLPQSRQFGCDAGSLQVLFIVDDSDNCFDTAQLALMTSKDFDQRFCAIMRPVESPYDTESLLEELCRSLKR
jgi:hypothetical protein